MKISTCSACPPAPLLRTSLIAVSALLLLHLQPGTVCGDEPEPAFDLNRDVGIDQRLDAQIPLDLTFRDETGNAVKLNDYFGEKPVILALVYYRCPMLCGLELNGLVRSLRAMTWNVGDEFRVLIVSIDPDEGPALAAKKRDSVLDQYGRNVNKDGWHFLTGEQPEIRSLAEAVGFRYVPTPENDQFVHAAGLMIITPQGRVSQYHLGVEYVPRDLRLSLVEASHNQIGTISDQLLLYCYLYDPSTGRYTLSILRLIRAVGIFTVVVIGGGIICMLRRERKNARDSVAVGDGPRPPRAKAQPS